MPKVAVIGGTGVYDPGILENVREEKIETEFGIAKVVVGYYRGEEVAFLNRHGAGHSLPPHLVNYRANIEALRVLGVQRVVATAAVGSLNPLMVPGDFVLVDQFLDFTKQRQATFYEGEERGVVHCDMTNPYCPHLREILFRVGSDLGLRMHQEGVYVCTEGPRFETAAEIRMFRMLGGDVVGMTSVPECVLAREAGMCYATVAMVTNMAAGITSERLTHSEVLEVMKANVSKLRQLLTASIIHVGVEPECECQAIRQEIEKLRQRKKG